MVRGFILLLAGGLPLGTAMRKDVRRHHRQRDTAAMGATAVEGPECDRQLTPQRTEQSLLGKRPVGEERRASELPPAIEAPTPKDFCTAWATGYNPHGQLGTGFTFNELSPVLVLSNVSMVSATGSHTLFLKNDGTVLASGLGSDGTVYTSGGSGPGLVKVLSGVRSVAAGDKHSLFLMEGGGVFAAGEATEGRLGFESSFHVTTPRPIWDLVDVQEVSAGDAHSLFLKKDGTVWASGRNNDGQLGFNETTSHVYTPVQVFSDAVAISAGRRHSLFLKKDGTAWATGKNFYGELGVGTNIASVSSPVQVLFDVHAIAAGGYHSVFVKKDGTAWVTGRGNYGQLGIGKSSIGQSWKDQWTNPFKVGVPVQVELLSDIRAAAAGDDHSIFLKGDHTAWGAGSNIIGQIGTGWPEQEVIPVQVLSDVRAVATGATDSYYLKTDCAQ